MMFGIGSIIKFIPETFVVELSSARIGDEPWVVGFKAIGWGVTVIGTSGSEMKTDVQPVAICCGKAYPLVSHWEMSHDAAKAEWSPGVSLSSRDDL